MSTYTDDSTTKCNHSFYYGFTLVYLINYFYACSKLTVIEMKKL